ncbi:hypothetical protein BH23THE1_BH23THE1_30000 [soil metagenome]
MQLEGQLYSIDSSNVAIYNSHAVGSTGGTGVSGSTPFPFVLLSSH